MKQVYIQLLQIQKHLVSVVPTTLVRGLYDEIDRDIHVLILGQRWIGKSTLLLQHLKQTERGFYFSADQGMIASVWLFQFVHYLVTEQEQTHIYIDEIFRYPDRSQELKNCLDSFPETVFYVTGSNSLSAYTGTADITRRMDTYHMYTLSFREFLEIRWKTVPVLSLQQILDEYDDLHTTQTLREEYLSGGCYPLYTTWWVASVHRKLLHTIDQVIIEDIWTMVDIHTTSLFRMKKLFWYLWSIPPSDLSITWLSQMLHIPRPTLENTLHLLSHTGIIHLIPTSGNITNKIRKQYKILLWNPNLYSMYQSHIWTIREAFFVQMMKQVWHDVYGSKKWDYIVTPKDSKKTYTFEIWGPSKSRKQIKDVWLSFVVKDVLYHDSAIPLRQFWLLS